MGSGGRALTKSKRSLQKNYQIINTQKYPFIKGPQSEAILDFVGSKGPSALSLQGAGCGGRALLNSVLFIP